MKPLTLFQINLIFCNLTFKHHNYIKTITCFLFVAFDTMYCVLMRLKNMIQIHGNCHSTTSNTLTCGHSKVFFFFLSLWTGLLSAAVTLSPQLISSQQVIKDAVFPFPFFCFSSAAGTMAGKEEKLQQQQYGTFTTRGSILFPFVILPLLVKWDSARCMVICMVGEKRRPYSTTYNWPNCAKKKKKKKVVWSW